MAQRVALERIIGMAVLELLFEAAADFDLIIRCDGYIAAVKKAVEIAPEEKAIVNSVGTTLVKGLYVGRLKSRQGMLIRDSTCTMISVSDVNPEGALAEARPNKRLFPKTVVFFLYALGLPFQVEDALVFQGVL